MNQRLLISLLTLIALSLSACQPTQNTQTTRPNLAAEQLAMNAEQSGDFLSAAQQYMKLASDSSQQQQARYYLLAAKAYSIANDDVQASNALSLVDNALLSDSQAYEAAILQAEIALASSQGETVLKALEPLNLNTLSDEQQRNVLKLRIRAYELTKNWLDKANSELELAKLLNNESEITANQKGLWESLMAMTPESLELFKPGMAPDVDSGWFELAYIVKSYKPNPEAFIVAIENWQRDYPRHPANPELYAPNLNEGTQLAKDLDVIAVLLPETGPYKSAAAAIKQAIITAHFVEQSNTQLRFYPVTTEPSNVSHQYQQAITDNASVVIGPLDKRAVQQLAEQNTLSIPVIALNRLSTNSSYPNLYQFGLAPEDDAVSVANYASLHSYQRAVVLSSDDNWGMRVAKAFEDQWLVNGGVLLGNGHYDATKNDFSSAISPLLGLESSKQRKDSLRQTLGRSIEFDPRRRQDIDFLFLAAKPLKARQLVPQLKFHRSGKLPIIATSQAYTGSPNSQQDIDLNKVIITDIPWIINQSTLNDPVYSAIKDTHPKYFDRFVRLYALGADAYRIIPELNGLSRSSDLSFPGATGTLTIDSFGKINRKTAWGQFNNGILQPLDVMQ